MNDSTGCPDRPGAASPRLRALVTGASAGIGAEFARQLAGRGLDLVLVARRGDRLRALADELAQAHGTGVEIVVADLSEPGAVATLCDALEARELPVDWLVNNAGSAGPDLLAEPGWDRHEAWVRLMQLSVMELCHRLVPPMQARGFGRIVNVASVAGRLIGPDGGHYGPVKAWMIAFSESLAQSCRPHGVHVCALCPGLTVTEFHAAAGLQQDFARIPGVLWYDAATVVREGLDAVDRGVEIRISGRLYRWLDPFTQSVVSRRLLKWLRARWARRMIRQR